MARSSSNLAGSKPVFRTGNVVTPAKALVTERKSARADFLPPVPLTSVAPVPLHVDGQANRESLASERAKVDTSRQRESLVAEIAGMERDKATGVFMLANGAMVRTEGMGDAPLADFVRPTAATAASTVPVAVPTAKQTRRAERKASDAAIITALAEVGINVTEITPRIREGWRDFVAAKRMEAGL